MSRRYWLRHLAFGGCIVAFLSASYAQDDSNQKRQTSQATEAQKQKVVEPNWNKPRCGEAKSHNEADLCEQRRMAEAAEQTVWLNTIQIIAGIVTVGLLFLTLHYSRKATNAAEVAAKAADLSAKASIGIKLPIVRCDAPRIWGVKDIFSQGGVGVSNLFTYDVHKVFNLEFRNRGETPFYPFEVGLGWLVTDQPAVELEVLPPEPTYTDIHSVSTETVVAEYYNFPTRGTFALRTEDSAFKQSLNSHDKNVRVLAYIKYLDFLETEHEARFCWLWHGSSRDGNQQAGLEPDNQVPANYVRKT